MQLNTLTKFFKFLLQLLLWLVSWGLKPLIELCTFIVVSLKFKDGFDYFNNKGLNADIRSSGDNRALWNFLIVKEKGLKFTKDTNKSISRYIGINYHITKEIKVFGIILYYLLYLIDVSTILKGGHCKNAIKKEDYI